MNFFEKRRLKKEQKRLEKRRKDIAILRNLSAVIICMIGFIGIMAGDYLMALFFILFGLSITPYFDSFMKQIGVNKPIRITISVLLFIMIGVAAPSSENPEGVIDSKPKTMANSIEEKVADDKEEAEISTKEKKNTEDSDNDNTSSDKQVQVEDGYEIIEVAACDLNGNRQANVKVDIGYGDREYWAYTNEHGQLVKVVAKEIILQDDSTEAVNADGKYCNDEAKVPGTEDPDLDEGHVIADSLGGVSNAYNITPQNSTLNRHGDQAYMEEAIRQAGGCTDFEAIITYPDTVTQIPSHYKYTYTINGNVVVDEFDNVNLEDVNNAIINNESNNVNTNDTANNMVDSPAATAPTESTVWIPATGTKYHNKPSCGNMNPDTATQTTQSEAEAMGYTPCKRCY